MKKAPLLYYVWRGYKMCKRTTSLLKGVAIGLVVCFGVMEGYKMLTSMQSPRSRRKRLRLKQDTGRAMRIVGDIIEDVEGMFLRK